MNKQQYLRKLKRLLKALPKQERESAIQYYEEYFDDAGAENFQAVANELGTPDEVSRQILNNYLEKQNNAEKAVIPKKSHKKALIIWAIILTLWFTVPVALGLACCIIGVAVSIASVYIGIVAAGFVAVACGIVGMVASIIVATSDFSTGILALGLSLLSIGVGLLLLMLGIWLFKITLSGCKKLYKKLSEKHKEKKKDLLKKEPEIIYEGSFEQEAENNEKKY